MKIGIDVSQIVYGTGVSVYTKELVKNLLVVDAENEYVLFGGSLRGRKFLKAKLAEFDGNVEIKLALFPPALADLAWNKLHVLPFEKLTGEIDVYHSSDWVQAPSNAFKVTTIHDLAPFLYPRQTPKKIRDVHSRRLARVKQEVDRIIVPSKSTKEDLLKMGFGEKKIRVIYEAVDTNIFKPSSEKEIIDLRRKFRLNKDYLLVVGSNRRKNMEQTFKAFENMQADGVASQLVIVGDKDITLDEKRGVKRLGRVAEDELVKLYAGARALVYASNYEGFGLPILEAMACGCPVVTSNVSSMPEVAGKAAALVDPNRAESIAKGIGKVIKNRDEFVKKGNERVKEFSWEKMARETLGVYEECK